MKTIPPGMPRVGWHFDFHSHRSIRINHDPDVESMVRTLVEGGVEEIVTFAKGHTGFAYFPTQVGTIHPRMRGDAFGDVVAAAADVGLRVLAYISFGVDGEAGRRHPEWVQMRAPGTPDFFSDDWFVNVCPFTAYLDELMLPMIAEIVAAYPIDGFFFDTMGALRVCHCDTCQAAFADACGVEIPQDPDSEDWGAYGQFRHDRGWRMIERVCHFINACRADLDIGFNQIGTVRFPEGVPRGVTRLTLDFTTTGPQSLQASLCAAYGGTADLPSDVINTIYNQGWADWSPRPPQTLEQTCAAIWARRARPYLGDRAHPANRLTPHSVRAIRRIAAVQRDMAAHYPPANARLTPDVLVLHGPGALYGADFADFDRLSSPMLPVKGAHRLLLDAGANFALVAEDFLVRHLAAVPLVVLPEMRAIREETDHALQAFVENGGTLLVVGMLPRVAAAPLAWSGIRRDAAPWQDHIYLPSWDGSTHPEPLLVRGDFHRIHLGAATVIAYATAPYDGAHGIRFGQGIGPPADAPSNCPALTRHAAGAGAVWYLEGAIFSDYAAHGNWTQVGWMRQLLARILPRPTASLCTACGSVEVVAHGNRESTWVFLVHHGGEQILGAKGWSRTLSPLPPRSLEVTIRDLAGRAPQAVSMLGEEVAWQFENGAVLVRFTLDRSWSIIRVDWD